MPGPWPWLARKFDFNFPAGKYPDLIERLRGTPARLEERIRSIRPDILTRREGDTWTIQENVGHLLDVEALWSGRLDDFLAEKDGLRAADLTHRRTNEADYNNSPIETLLDAYRSERMQLVDRLESLEAETFGRTARHPRLKTPMRLVDSCLFAADHDDYHLARITELARKLQA
jgi:uncharacterized damage-inducible protein DinB